MTKFIYNMYTGIDYFQECSGVRSWECSGVRSWECSGVYSWECSEEHSQECFPKFTRTFLCDLLTFILPTVPIPFYISCFSSFLLTLHFSSFLIKFHVFPPFHTLHPCFSTCGQKIVHFSCWSRGSLYFHSLLPDRTGLKPRNQTYWNLWASTSCNF